MMDQAREASVWERVRAASAGAPLPLPTPSLPAEPEQPQEGTVSADDLLRWSEEELGRSLRYRMLADCTCGAARQSLWCLARRAGENSRKLGALYYIQQGRRACPQPEALPCCVQPAMLLRQLYLEEAAAEAAYLTAGERNGELLPMGQKKAETVCRLLHLLTQFV